MLALCTGKSECNPQEPFSASARESVHPSVRQHLVWTSAVASVGWFTLQARDSSEVGEENNLGLTCS